MPKPTFMAVHKNDVDQVSALLAEDWKTYRQIPEVSARIESFRADRRYYFNIRQRSLDSLSEQWENGVRGIHDNCSIVPEEELLRWQYNDKLLSKFGAWHIVHEDEMSEAEIAHRESIGLQGRKRLRTYEQVLKKHDGRFISDRYRCGSITCRPGDPFGCALGKRRMHMDRIAMILQAWDKHGGEVVALEIGVYGAPDGSLASVLEVEQDAFNSMVSGGGWLALKKEFSIQGYLSVLSVKRDNEMRRWGVTRWIVLARQASPTGWEGLASDLSGRWGRRIGQHSAYTRAVSTMIHVEEFQLTGFAQFVSGAVSPLDAAVPGTRCAHFMAWFALEEGERSINDLWQTGGSGWEELVRALHGRKMIKVSSSSTDHPAWKFASKHARDSFGQPDWRRPARPQLSFDGLPAAPTPYEVISPSAARRRKIKSGDRVFVLEAGQSWDEKSRDHWRARQDEQLARYRRAAGVGDGLRKA